MGTNPKSGFVDFKAIKARISITQVLERYGLIPSLKVTGDRMSGPCPLHGGSNPTQFRVSIAKNCYNCFGDCHAGGNVIDFVAKKENIPFRDAAVLLGEWFQAGAEPAPRTAESPAKSAPAQLADEKAEASPREPSGPNLPLDFALKKLDFAHPYLAERGLSAEAVAEFGVGYCGKGSMRGRIAIPIHNGAGELIAYAGRWPGDPPSGTEKYRLPVGFRKSQELFNLHRAMREPAEGSLIIVEGFFACMALWQRGIRRAVALMGSTMSADQEELILKMVTPGERAFLMLDENEAGRAGRRDIASRLAPKLYLKVWRSAVEEQQPDELGLEELAALCA